MTQTYIPLLPIDPNGRTANDPLGHFKASDLDANSEPQYYGFLTVDGAWYILKTSNGGSVIRYCSGAAFYLTAWANRESLGYDYFDIIF